MDGSSGEEPGGSDGCRIGQCDLMCKGSGFNSRFGKAYAHPPKDCFCDIDRRTERVRGACAGIGYDRLMLLDVDIRSNSELNNGPVGVLISAARVACFNGDGGIL